MSRTDAPGVSESWVAERYSSAAQAREEALCCPVEYAGDYLKAIPPEILERDYGCGNPSPYVQRGDVVLDLGSGGGKLCYIMSQIVGPTGRVIGVDCNRDMLQLARSHQASVAEKIGFHNVSFRNGMIQDLRLDLDLLDRELAARPVRTHADWLELRNTEERLRREHPLVESDSVDCVVSNCVLNLVRSSDRRQLFHEIFRVLKPGGRAAISDIVSNVDIPPEMQQDPELWSGCLSGAFREDAFFEAFEAAGFHGMELAKRQQQPWRVINGIEFRSVTVIAWKAAAVPPSSSSGAVIYRGPFRFVEDDRGRQFHRGVSVSVDHPTMSLLRKPPYASSFEVSDAGKPGSTEAGLLGILNDANSCCGGSSASGCCDS